MALLTIRRHDSVKLPEIRLAVMARACDSQPWSLGVTLSPLFHILLEDAGHPLHFGTLFQCQPILRLQTWQCTSSIYRRPTLATYLVSIRRKRSRPRCICRRESGIHGSITIALEKIDQVILLPDKKIESSNLNRETMKMFIDVFFEMLAPIEDAKGILPVRSFQAITVPAMEAMEQNGGNTLGLDASQGSIFIANLAILWSDAADNDRIFSFSNSLYERLVVEAGKKGLNNDYIYMNYTAP